jgi:hypothetical protein
MSTSTTQTPTPSRRRLLALLVPAAVAVGLVVTAIAGPSASAHDASPMVAAHGHGAPATMSPTDRATAMLATSPYQDVATAEAAGWASTLGTLGCFQDPAQGGMGVHYLNQSLMDGVVDARHPEALVYELDATGAVTGLVAHEYIVPVDAWTSSRPPRLFGMDFHRHPVLPLWVLHTWLWKDNPAGVFADWNPAVRPCPAGVPIFGRDLP